MGGDMMHRKNRLLRAALAAFFIALAFGALAQSFQGTSPLPQSRGGTGKTNASDYFDAAFCTTNGKIVKRVGGQWVCADDGVVASQLDSAFCSTVGYLIARTTGGWVCSNSMPAPITWFGAVGDDATDNCTAIGNAIASGAKYVLVPGGTFRTSCGFTLNVAQTVGGLNEYSSVIKITSATLDLFTMPNLNSVVERLLVTSSVTRTAGCYFRITGSSNEVRDVAATNYFCLADYSGASPANSIIQPKLLRIHAFTNVGGAGSYAVRFQNYSSPIIEDAMFAGVGGTQPEKCFIIGDGDTILIDIIHCVGHGLGLSIEPTGGNFAGAIFVSNCLFDSTNGSSVDAAKINVPNAASVITAAFTNCSFSNSTGATSNGFKTATAGTWSIDGLFFTNSVFNHNTANGADLRGAVTNIHIQGGCAAGNTLSGYAFGTGNAKFTVHGVTAGPCGGFGGNGSIGINVVGGSTASDFDISGNNVSGNTSVGVFDGSSGANRKIHDNTGFNPVGGASITVGASPFTYTASSSPETVYIRGGTVSNIATGGQNIFTATNATVELGPLETVTVTYSSAPTMVKSVH